MTPSEFNPSGLTTATEPAPEPGVSHVEAIQTVIASLDQYDEAFVNHTQEGYIWTFRYGSVKVFIQLTGTTDDDTFTVWSPVLTLPVAHEAALLRQLLELNWLSTAEAQFALLNQQVVVVSSRGVADLSAGEITRLITVVASVADEYDELLQTQYPAGS
ncbi:MAG: YbjN domain-containing protein [Nodosilinea sp.]